MFHEAAEGEANRLQAVIHSAFGEDTTCLAGTLQDKVMAAFNVKERQAKALISRASKAGWVTRQQRPDRLYEYVLHNVPADNS